VELLNAFNNLLKYSYEVSSDFKHLKMCVCCYIYIGLEPKDYEEKVKSSWIWSDLKEVRNVRPSFHTKLGLFGGMAYSGFTLAVKGKEPWTLSHGGKQTKVFFFKVCLKLYF